jgi:hypothetical protein
MRVQAPAVEEDKFEDAVEPGTEQGAAAEKSRFAYQSLVTEPEVAGAPSRGKDGHLTISGISGQPKVGGMCPLPWFVHWKQSTLSRMDLFVAIVSVNCR